MACGDSQRRKMAIIAPQFRQNYTIVKGGNKNAATPGRKKVEKNGRK